MMVDWSPNGSENGNPTDKSTSTTENIPAYEVLYNVPLLASSQLTSTLVRHPKNASNHEI